MLFFITAVLASYKDWSSRDYYNYSPTWKSVNYETDGFSKEPSSREYFSHSPSWRLSDFEVKAKNAINDIRHKFDRRRDERMFSNYRTWD